MTRTPGGRRRPPHQQERFEAVLDGGNINERNGVVPDRASARAPQTTLLYVHVRRDLVESGAPLQAVLDDVNRVVLARGAIVLASGQFLHVPLEATWDLDTHYTEFDSFQEDHVLRAWGDERRTYFGGLWGVTDPFQYAEEGAAYDQYAVNVRVPAPYLVAGERILALIDAERDGMRFYCPCHSAEVVYTSMHRLVCMGCGELHCVLSRALDRPPGNGVASEDWDAFFDEEGELLDEDASLSIVDFQEIESVPKLWTTDAWTEASRTVEFFARASDEEYERYRGSVVTSGMLVEAGFSHVPTPPPPALQFGEYEYAIDLASNAAAAVKAGAAGYARGNADIEELRGAVLQLFQAVELVLKIRLASIDPGALDRQPNNPTVLRALRAAGVTFSQDEEVTIRSLRQLRNKLQHGEASFAYRRARALLRRTLVFLDRFTLEELGWWLGEVVRPPAWHALLRLEPIRQNAERVAERMVRDAHAQPECVVERCPRCERETLIRTKRHGSECAYCGDRPTVEDLYPDENLSTE